jgi:hypothetical protein
MDLSLPPKGEYTTYKLLEKAAQAHARTAGYAFNIGPGKGKDPNTGRQQKTLICHKGGKYKTSLTDEVHRIKKKRKTEKCQCPFAVKAKERPTGLWELCHFKNLIKATHNHPLFDHASDAWQHCKLTFI